MKGIPTVDPVIVEALCLVLRTPDDELEEAAAKLQDMITQAEGTPLYYELLGYAEVLAQRALITRPLVAEE